MIRFVTVDQAIFSDPWNREKESPLIPGELCIICKNDANHDLNRYAVIREVEHKEEEDYFTVEYFSRNDKVEVEVLTQDKILFVPWPDDDLSYNNFINSHVDIVQWVIAFREARGYV